MGTGAPPVRFNDSGALEITGTTPAAGQATAVLLEFVRKQIPKPEND